jgi:uncharacterized membrane protein YgdD (TMEM256/DUF423 family)
VYFERFRIIGYFLLLGIYSAHGLKHMSKKRYTTWHEEGTYASQLSVAVTK